MNEESVEEFGWSERQKGTLVEEDLGMREEHQTDT